MKTVVNSWNEWDPLKHVIVGRADDCHIPPEEPALDAKVPEDSDMRGQWGRRPQETIDRANELLDNFASVLEKRGIRVDRPTPIDFSLPAITPDLVQRASLAVCRLVMYFLLWDPKYLRRQCLTAVVGLNIFAIDH